MINCQGCVGGEVKGIVYREKYIGVQSVLFETEPKCQCQVCETDQPIYFSLSSSAAPIGSELDLSTLIRSVLGIYTGG